MDTVPISQDFKAWLDTDRRLDFVFNPIPSGGILGWTIIWKLVKVKGGRALMTKSATVISPSAATFYVRINKADWAGMRAGNYYWEAYRSDSGDEEVVAVGNVVVEERA